MMSLYKFRGDTEMEAHLSGVPESSLLRKVETEHWSTRKSLGKVSTASKESSYARCSTGRDWLLSYVTISEKELCSTCHGTLQDRVLKEAL